MLVSTLPGYGTERALREIIMVWPYVHDVNEAVCIISQNKAGIPGMRAQGKWTLTMFKMKRM